MAAQKPTRPDPGHSLVLPRVTDDATQRGFDRIALGVRQQQARADAIMTEVTATQDAVAAVPTSGRFLAERELTGTGSGTFDALTNRVYVRMVACGGGGGGAGGGANVAAGAGGSTGVYLEFWLTVTPGGSFSYVAPTTGGAAGSSAGGNGGNGSDCTFTAAGTTYTAKGGGGGHGLASSTAGFALPTSPAAGSSSGAGIRSTYDIGDPGVVISTSFWFSGSGGTTPWGHGAIGGNDGTGSGAGIDGGPGGGGSGATEKAGGPGKAGGQGGPALIVMWEYS